MNKAQRAIFLAKLLVFMLVLTQVQAAPVDCSQAIWQLADWENHANNARSRQKHWAPMRYYALRSEWTWAHGVEDLPREVQKVLFGRQGGRSVLRLPVHPEDTWVAELIEILEQDQSTKVPLHVDDPSVSTTSSRSLLVAGGGYDFGLKVGTNTLFGETVRRKSYKRHEAELAVDMSRFIAARERQLGLQDHVLFVKDIAAYGVDQNAMCGRQCADDLTVSVRDYSALIATGQLYLPAFSAFDEAVGREIAAANGSSRPADFWTKAYCEKSALTDAEALSLFGVVQVLNHGQNKLVQLDASRRTTGLFAIRDTADFRVIDSIAEKLGISTRKIEDYVVSGREFEVTFLPLGVNPQRTAPSWLTPQAYEECGDRYFQVFHRALKNYGLRVEIVKQDRQKRDGYTSRFTQTLRLIP